MLNLILLASIAVSYNCKDTIIENKSKEAWNNHDDSMLSRAMDRCIVHFKNSPCLVKFTKTGFQSYTAICGQETK